MRRLHAFLAKTQVYLVPWAQLKQAGILEVLSGWNGRGMNTSPVWHSYFRCPFYQSTCRAAATPMGQKGGAALGPGTDVSDPCALSAYA